MVQRSQFEDVLAELLTKPILALDTEGTGVAPYQGDRLFSIIIATSTEDAYYFNFQEYSGVHSDWVLPREWISKMSQLWDKQTLTWFMHYAPYDMHILWQEGVELRGDIHCTYANARVVYNDHPSYGLDACAKRIGLEKSDAVEDYIKEHHLWEWEEIPGKKTRSKKKFFDKVPLDIIAPYGLQDATVCYALGVSQCSDIEALGTRTPAGAPNVRAVHENEKRLTPVIFRMERTGIRIDRGFSERAFKYEEDRALRFAEEFGKLCGKEFRDSPKYLAEIFQSQGHHLPLTEKGQPSTKSSVLYTINSDLSKAVLDFRDAKSKAEFYATFLQYADKNDRIHPGLIQGGTGTGRLAGRDPNFQNLTNEEDVDLSQEFLVRRAVIPSPGTFFFCPDFDQMEYRLMLDYAGEIELIRRIIEEGLDVHQATADMMGVTRKEAKTLNFMLLYGGGAQKLADALGISLYDARRLKMKYFAALPKVAAFIQRVIQTAKVRGYVFNWVGRRSYFPNSEFAYKAPNYLIQGGCADVVKKAMVEIDRLLSGTKSRMLLQVHDELLFEIAFGEEFLIEAIRSIMSGAYPHKHIPLTVGCEVAYKSWADKEQYKPQPRSVGQLPGLSVPMGGQIHAS